MKGVLLNIFLLVVSSISYASCFNDDEYKLISDSLPSGDNYDYYESSPYRRIYNIVECQKSSLLSDIACNNIKFRKSLLLLAMGEIYAYENATYTPVGDYSTYNNEFRDWLNNVINKEKDKKIASRKLCYIIKTKLSDDFGGDFYYSPKIREVISSSNNKNGLVINSLDSIIYLGKSCDAVVSNDKKAKSIWYNDGDQFAIAQLNKDGKFEEKYRFNYDDKVAKLNCVKPL